MAKSFELEWWHIALAVGAIILFSNQAQGQWLGIGPVFIAAMGSLGGVAVIILALIVFGGSDVFKWIIGGAIFLLVFTSGLLGSDIGKTVLIGGMALLAIMFLFNKK